MRKTSYPLDCCGIVHLSTMRKNHANTFRIVGTLTQPIIPELLQKATEQITPQFPTIAAGIQRSFFQYHVVPVTKPIPVQPETICLAYMSRQEMAQCAIRILYHETQIILECFHSLTDGYGGMVFLNALITHYLVLACPEIDFNEALSIATSRHDSELTDDFRTHAGTKTTPANHRTVYLMPVQRDPNETIRVTIGSYDTDELCRTARSFGVSLTTFLTAAMFDAIIELQKEHISDPSHYEPIQIFVPVDLRRRFKSNTLRNFSLYALPCITPTKETIPFADLIHDVAEQLKQQFSKEHLRGLITTSVRSQSIPVFQVLPLPVKDLVMNVVHHFCGKRNSCLTLTNVGEISISNDLRPYVKRIDCALTPRVDSLYNCGIMSYAGQLHICFSNKNTTYDLEHRFFRRLADLGCRGQIEYNRT